ncbi:MAG TPA: Fur family transcriptional regulator [Thermoleophilaceae bacterium]|nr:Fur family transcriptional regulator [Thermoleophilaceae bacterium]
MRPAEADRRLSELLRERGMRVTQQRLVLHRTLRELDRHVTADELLDSAGKRLPNASLPTVYAALELFEELGLVRRVPAPTGATLYDPRTDEHQHLVCRRCGAVEDLDARVEVSSALRAARRRGFRPAAAELVVSGECSACAAA